jgi:hypothetical protein
MQVKRREAEDDGEDEKVNVERLTNNVYVPG